MQRHSNLEKQSLSQRGNTAGERLSPLS